eukprot:gene10705-biopygen145
MNNLSTNKFCSGIRAAAKPRVSTLHEAPKGVQEPQLLSLGVAAVHPPVFLVLQLLEAVQTTATRTTARCVAHGQEESCSCFDLPS